VGESVSNGTLWDTRRPPRGYLALPSMWALLGGPYNTPIRGTLVDTMVSNLEQRRLSSLGLRKGFLEVEEKGLWKWGNALYGSSFRETWGSFVGGPEGYEKKALGMSFYRMGAQLGHLEWPPLPGTLRYG